MLDLINHLCPSHWFLRQFHTHRFMYLFSFLLSFVFSCVFYFYLLLVFAHFFFVASSVTYSAAIFLWTDSHLHHGRIWHIDNSSGFFALFKDILYVSHSKLFFCNSDASFSAVSINIAVVSARSRVKSLSHSSLFWVIWLCLPHTRLSLYASKKIHLQSQSIGKSLQSTAVF